MKLNSIELLGALSKVSGIVSDKSVVEELKSYHILPDAETKLVKIAGTDSMMTLIEEIPFEPTEGSDLSLLVLGADKVLEIIKYAGAEVELVYTGGETEESEEVHIVTPKSKIVIRKHFGLSDDIIDFEMGDEDNFDDEIPVNVLKTVLSSLASLIDSTNTDPAAKTIFLNGTKAIIGDDITLSTINLETTGKYEFNIKVVKQILSLLGSLDGESIVQLKKYDDENKILIKTEKDIFKFSIYDVYEPELEIIEEFESQASLLVSKEDFIRGLHLVKATSEDDKVNITLKEGEVVLESYFEGENATDNIPAPKCEIKVDGGIKFESLASQLVKLATVIDSEGIVLTVDPESSILLVREPRKKIVSAVTVRIID